MGAVGRRLKNGGKDFHVWKNCARVQCLVSPGCAVQTCICAVPLLLKFDVSVEPKSSTYLLVSLLGYRYGSVSICTCMGYLSNRIIKNILHFFKILEGDPLYAQRSIQDIHLFLLHIWIYQSFVWMTHMSWEFYIQKRKLWYLVEMLLNGCYEHLPETVPVGSYRTVGIVDFLQKGAFPIRDTVQYVFWSPDGNPKFGTNNWKFEAHTYINLQAGETRKKTAR